MKIKFYYWAIAILSMAGIRNVSAQTEYFSELPSNSRRDQSVSKNITKIALYRLKTTELRNYLRDAPMEFKGKSIKGLALEIPMPNGVAETFILFESPILAPEVAAKHPEIKTYAGKGANHKEYSIRINLTSTGFNAIILGVENDAVYYEKTNTDSSDNTYRSYFSRDAISPKNDSVKTSGNRCGTLDGESHRHPLKIDGSNKRSSAVAATGTTLRTFRLAMAADAEFTAQKGGTAALAYDALTNYVNNMNAVYRKELSISFVLVSDETVVYTDPLTDPYTNDDQGTMLSENQTNLDNVIGAGYDIGHVLGFLGGSGGGVAVRGSVCDPSVKGQGTSGVGDGSYADVFDQQLIQHEVGHQFDMSHSYNSNVPVCTTRAYDTSVEPGSGTTIMSYGYTCSNTTPADGLIGNDDYETGYAPILNFHTVNYDQANAFIQTLSCYTSTATGNTVPIINAMQSTWTIPRSTPFALAGSATDSDAADVLSYSWEGTNISDETDKAALTAATISDLSRPPFFRSYAPVSASESTQPGTRYYPRLSSVLDGSNYAIGDKLPSVGVATTHKFTVRDNDSGVSAAEVTVNVDGGSGPFLITNDASGSLLGPIGSYPLGGAMTVNWSVNGTAGSPVNCTLVDIFLSTDGGLTFPTILVTATLNILGTATVILPLIDTNKARIKIAPSSSTALGNTPNVFFDISNVDFAIGSPMPVTLVSFNAKLISENIAVLTWETSSETSNKGFEIEMSLDSRKFIQVGFMDGAGNSKSEHKYQYPITGLSAGTYYFRLKQLDYDGTFEYSRIRSIKLDDPKDIVALYPNPTGGKLRIRSLSNINNEPCSLEVIDQSGRIVIALPLSTSYSNDYELDAGTLSSGLYSVIIRGASFTERLKFVKQ